MSSELSQTESAFYINQVSNPELLSSIKSTSEMIDITRRDDLE